MLKYESLQHEWETLRAIINQLLRTVSCLCLKFGKYEYYFWEAKMCPTEIFLGN